MSDKERKQTVTLSWIMVIFTGAQVILSSWFFYQSLVEWNVPLMFLTAVLIAIWWAETWINVEVLQHFRKETDEPSE